MDVDELSDAKSKKWKGKMVALRKGGMKRGWNKKTELLQWK